VRGRRVACRSFESGRGTATSGHSSGPSPFSHTSERAGLRQPGSRLPPLLASRATVGLPGRRGRRVDGLGRPAALTAASDAWRCRALGMVLAGWLRSRVTGGQPECLLPLRASAPLAARVRRAPDHRLRPHGMPVLILPEWGFDVVVGFRTLPPHRLLVRLLGGVEMRRVGVVLAVLVGLVLTFAIGASATTAPPGFGVCHLAKNQSGPHPWEEVHFATQQQAQAWLNAHPSDFAVPGSRRCSGPPIN
jgi:hypothetical protein